MSDYYILDGKTPVKVEDTVWSLWYEKNNRRVDQTYIGDIRISTVFLGLDHSFGDGPPLIFETMIFGRVEDEETGEYQTRCSTWEEAEDQHAYAVALVMFGRIPNDP